MTGFSSISQLLDEYVPEVRSEEAAWKDVLVRAALLAEMNNGAGAFRPIKRARPARRPLSVALAIAAAAVLLVPLIAFAAGHRWWFERPGAVAPQGVKPLAGELSVFASGKFGGERWTAVAYVSKDPSPVYGSSATGGRLACVSVILGKLSSKPSSPICGAPIGMTDVRKDTRRAWVLNGFPLYWPLTTGLVAKGVARVEIVVANHGKTTTVDVPLLSTPEVGGGIRFFALAYATKVGSSARIESISAYSSSGALLQHNNNIVSSHGSGTEAVR